MEGETGKETRTAGPGVRRLDEVRAMGSRQRKPRSTGLGRLIRGRSLGRNPLRRGSDRAETVIIAMLAAAFAASVPFAAAAADEWGHAAAHREQIAQQADRSRVPAVTLTEPSAFSGEAGAALTAEAKARWTAPDGTAVVSQIPVPLGTRPGSTVRIWVARDGAVTNQPLLDSQVSGWAALAEAGAVAGLAVTLTIAGAASRKSLDRHRLAAWEAEWRTAGPRWTTRT